MIGNLSSIEGNIADCQAGFQRLISEFDVGEAKQQLAKVMHEL